MAHQTLKTSYDKLTERINRFPQGAPPSDLLDKILKIIFNEKEAELVSLMPIKPFTAKKASKIWKKSLLETNKILEELAHRAILVDVERNGESVYTLPPPMAGFFEFSMMRLRDDIDQKTLAELFYQYLNVEEDFIKDLFCDGETQLGRTFVNEPVLSNENAVYVLDYERASEVIKSATFRGVGMCYCRHKMLHLNKACDAPMDICMTFNNSAQSLIKHGHARQVDVSEGIDLLQLAYEHNLVQFGENVRQNVNFICNCCGCCCEALLAAKRFAYLSPIHTTNFIPILDEKKCTGCGKCAEICPVDAIQMERQKDESNKKIKAVLDEERCLGCGLCARNCNKEAITIVRRKERVITPLNSVHRAVVMAIERGKLQHLLFDNRVLFSHRALAAVLGVFLKLPPIRQIMAQQQIKSRYLETLMKFAK